MTPTFADPASTSPPPTTGNKRVLRPFRRRASLAQSEYIGPVWLGLDLVCWLTAYGLMLWLRHHTLTDQQTIHTDARASVCFVQFSVLAICLFIAGGYDRRTNFLSLGYMSEHCIALLAAGIVGGLLIYAGAAYAQALRPSRGVFLSSLATFAPLSLWARRRLGVALQAELARSYFLVLGTGEKARHFYRSYLASTNRERLRFITITPQQEAIGQPIDAADPAGPRVEWESLVELAVAARESNGIIVADSAHQMPADLVDWLTRQHYEDVPVYTLETFYERYWRRVPIYAIEPIWPLQMGRQLTNQSPYSHAKRLFDLFAAALGLVTLSPLFLVLALLVLLESGRPVFFCQRRIGRDRRAFSLCKFRSMYVRLPGQEGSLYTGERDARITRVGHWLRKLRLDELPQLWNVFKGDMSLIGPRAEWDQLVERYDKLIPCYHFRHLVKPGITGWAQVNYPYGASVEDAEQKLKYDLYYIRHYSLRLDAMICLKTLHIMLWGKGQ